MEWVTLSKPLHRVYSTKTIIATVSAPNFPEGFREAELRCGFLALVSYIYRFGGRVIRGTLIDLKQPGCPN